MTSLSHRDAVVLFYKCNKEVRSKLKIFFFLALLQNEKRQSDKHNLLFFKYFNL